MHNRYNLIKVALCSVILSLPATRLAHAASSAPAGSSSSATTTTIWLYAYDGPSLTAASPDLTLQVPNVALDSTSSYFTASAKIVYGYAQKDSAGYFKTFTPSSRFTCLDKYLSTGEELTVTVGTSTAKRLDVCGKLLQTKGQKGSKSKTGVFFVQ